MTDTSHDVLTDSFINEGRLSRKALLPLWIKIFAWIFIVFSFITPIALIGGIIMHSFELSIYGLEANTPYSMIGAMVSLLFMFKGVVAFGLLRRHDWAVTFGLIDAVIGIAICIIIMIFPVVTNNDFSFRLELVALIPYLMKLLKIKEDWINAI